MSQTVNYSSWTSVSSKTNWPTPVVVSSKNIPSNEWTSSWSSALPNKGNTTTKTAEIINPLKKTLPVETSVDQIASLNKNQSNSFSQTPTNNLFVQSVVSPEEIENEKKEATKSIIEEELAKQSLYKTELCRSFSDTGSCRYGHKCQFAHGEHELRPLLRHPKYKTEYCKRFSTTGNCPYGPRCRFIHPGVPGGNIHWSSNWAADVAADQLAQLSLKTNISETGLDKQQNLSDESQNTGSETPRRLAIFSELDKS